jgi:hypothetical protein
MRWIPLLLIWLLIPSVASGQAETASLAGIVMQVNGEELVLGANVELLKDGMPIKSAATDVSGRYRFEDLSAGRYAVVASFIGTTGVHRDVVIRDGEDVELDLSLGFRITEEDYEYGRREAREDLARGVRTIRTLADRPIVRTGHRPCADEELVIRDEIASRNYGLAFVEVYAGYNEVPEEVLWARIEGYNEEVDRWMRAYRGQAWRDSLWRQIGRETVRRHPECFE